MVEFDWMEYHGLEIDSGDDVYAPSDDSFLAADMVDSTISEMGKGLDVLDMGCGTGILGLVAANMYNVERVVFADINESAIDFCRKNIKSNIGILHAECSVVKSNLFSNVDGRFDFIIFNAPYLPDDDRIKLSESWYGGDGGVELSIRFLDDAVGHLKPNGRILLVESSFGEIGRLYKALEASGFSIKKERRIHITFEDIIALVVAR